MPINFDWATPTRGYKPPTAAPIAATAATAAAEVTDAAHPCSHPRLALGLETRCAFKLTRATGTCQLTHALSLSLSLSLSF